MSSEGQLEEHNRRTLASFLTRPDVDSYFRIHPNQVALPSFVPPPEWNCWWDWAIDSDMNEAQSEDDKFELKWLLLWRYYISGSYQIKPSHEVDFDFTTIPTQLRELLDHVRELPLNRIPSTLPRNPLQTSRENTHGMSPKKVHEVNRMTTYVSQLISNLDEQNPIQHVVDIGAGQAYLSRALRDRLGLNVLALDWSDVQAKGAARRERTGSHGPALSSKEDLDSDEKCCVGSLTYQTVDITQESLLISTGDWMSRSGSIPLQQPCSVEEKGFTTAPVLLVALHACGSLTLDIFRALASRIKNKEPVAGSETWRPTAAVIVGCCYNLLRPEDTVLNTGDEVPITLTSNHLQLAAQTPSEWGRSAKSMEDAKLAIKKVSWRAILEGILLRARDSDGASNEEGLLEGEGRKRLGRLNDSVYTRWDDFVAHAERRLGVGLAGFWKKDELEQRVAAERRLEVLQVLRCVMGPVVESFIILDRKDWLRKRLKGTGLRVELVNLFDQASGSGRNVAVVVS